MTTCQGPGPSLALDRKNKKLKNMNWDTMPALPSVSKLLEEQGHFEKGTLGPPFEDGHQRELQDVHPDDAKEAVDWFKELFHRADCGRPTFEENSAVTWTALPARKESADEPIGCIEFCSKEGSNLTMLLGSPEKKGLRLTPDFLDCANNEMIDVLIEQIGASTGA